MPLYEDLAKQILTKNADNLMAMTPEARKKEIDNVVNKVESNPALNITADSPLELEKEIDEGETAYSKILAQWDKRNRGKLESYRETYVPKRWNALRQLHRDSDLTKQGVILDRDLPAGEIELGFGVEPVRSLKGALTKYFNDEGYKGGVPVFKSGEDIIYIDPTDKKPVRVNPGWLAKAGQGIPVATEVGGTLAVTKGTSSPAAMVAKEAGAGGLGAGVGELIRLSIGKHLDAHDLTDTEIWKKSGIYAGTSATITAGIGSLLAGAKGLINLRTGGLFNKSDAVEVGIPIEAADQVVGELNQYLKSRGKKGQFSPTLAQKADDALIESGEAELRRNVEYAPRFRERDLLNIQAEQDALEAITAPSVKPYAPSTVTDVTEKRVARRVEQAKDIVRENTSQLKRELDQIGTVQKEAVGADTLATLQAKDQAEEDAVDESWDVLREIGGYNPKTRTYGIEIPAGVRTKKVEALFKRQASTARTTAGSPPHDIFVGQQKGKAADLSDYNNELSRLKKKYRQISNNGTATDIDTVDLNQVIKSMEGDRKLALFKAGRRDLIRQIDTAEKATAAYHDTYKTSVIGDLTRLNKNGVPEIKSQSFVDNMLNRDVSEVDDLLSTISSNPELIMQWKEGIANAYKREAYRETTEGVLKFSRKASNEFLDKYKHVLERPLLFSKAEINSLKKTGSLSQKVERQSMRLKAFKKKAETLWGSGKLSKIDPDNLVKFVTSSDGSWITASGQGVQDRLKKIKFVRNVTRGYPGAWQDFQNKFTSRLRSDLVTDARTGRINPKKIATWISGDNESRMIKEIMGKRYYDDLVKVNKVIQMLNKPMSKLAANEANRGWIQTVRAGVAPPLTKRGRGFTALLTFGSAEGHRRTADALLNQNTIRDVAELAEHNAWTRQFFEKAASLGYLHEEEIK